MFLPFSFSLFSIAGSDANPLWPCVVIVVIIHVRYFPQQDMSAVETSSFNHKKSVCN